MNITFGLLGLSICSVWLSLNPLGARVRISPWILLFIAALLAGLAGAYITFPAVICLVVFGIVSYLASSADASRLQRIFLGGLTAILALGLAIHRLPGFNN